MEIRPVHRGGGARAAGRGIALAGVALAAYLAAAAACQKGVESEGDARRDKPLATVGPDTVTVGVVADYMRQANLNRTLSSRDSAIEDMIAVELVKAAAREETLTPEQETRKKDWESQLRMSLFRDSVIGKGVTVPDSLVEKYYKDRVSEEVKARHILIEVSPTATPEQKQAAKARAEEALAKARAGEDFEKLSREYSEERTAATGGDLGWFGKGDMVPQFERAAFALKPGEISNVVETRFGYHVIKVEEQRKKTLEELRPEIVQTLEQPLKQEAFDKYRDKMLSESGLQFYEVNVDTLISIFQQDSVGELSPTRAGLPLATWRGGKLPDGKAVQGDTLTIDEIVQRYHDLPKENQAAVKALDRDRMIDALSRLVPELMLAAQAEAAQLKFDPERQKMLDDRVEGLLVTELLRKHVRDGAQVSDAEVRAAWEADSQAYVSRTLEAATPEIRKALMQEKMERVNSQQGQRALIHEVAKRMEGKVGVERFQQNYELVLAELAPADSAARAAAEAEKEARAQASKHAAATAEAGGAPGAASGQTGGGAPDTAAAGQGATPGEAPGGGPDSAPEETPAGGPGSAPEETPAGGPDSAPEASAAP